MSVTFRKPFLDSSDVDDLRRYARHIEPVLREFGIALRHADILREMARQLGYRDWEDLVDYNRSSVLFSDVYQLIHAITPAILSHAAENHGRIFAAKDLAHAQKVLTQAFRPPDPSRWIKDFASKSTTHINTLLVPKATGRYGVLSFASPTELALRLESNHEMILPEVDVPDLAAHTNCNPEPQRFTYPVYRHLRNILPPGSVFVADDDTVVVGFDYVASDGIDFEGTFQAIMLTQQVFQYPYGIVYRFERRGDQRGLALLMDEMVPPFFLPMGEDVIKRRFGTDAEEFGFVIAEAAFCPVTFRGPVPKTRSYIDCCNQMITTLYTG